MKLKARRPLPLPLLALVLALTVACGSKTQRPQSTAEPAPPPPPAEPVVAERSPTQEELERVPPPPPVQGTAEGWSDEAPPPPPPASRTTTFGYRVQVFASSTRSGAEERAAEVRGRLSEPVVVDYEAPFYKVRMGNCVTRHEAERLRERAVEAGYEGAFVTETLVEVR